MYPTLFSFDDLHIYSYPLFIGLAWGFSYQISQILIAKNKIAFKNYNFFVLGLFIMTWLGAKLLFLLTSVSNNHNDYLVNSNFWLGGGFVFYGGLIFGLLYIILYRQLFDRKLQLNDLIIFAPALSFGHGIGRIGCLLAGCCYGKETDFFFSVFIHNANRYPVQLCEAICLITLGIFLTSLILKKVAPLKVLSIYLISYGLLRFVLEYFRGDSVRGIYFLDLSTSQIISIVLVLGVLLYNLGQYLKARKI